MHFHILCSGIVASTQGSFGQHCCRGARRFSARGEADAHSRGLLQGAAFASSQGNPAGPHRTYESRTTSYWQVRCGANSGLRQRISRGAPRALSAAGVSSFPMVPGRAHCGKRRMAHSKRWRQDRGVRQSGCLSGLPDGKELGPWGAPCVQRRWQGARSTATPRGTSNRKHQHVQIAAGPGMRSGLRSCRLSM